MKREDLMKRCKRHFGTTDNPYDAGFILPDGEMLNFHREASLKAFTAVKSHGEIQECFPPSSTKSIKEWLKTTKYWSPEQWFITSTGSVRIDALDHSLETSVNYPLTLEQKRIISEVCPGGCHWDVLSPQAEVCETSSYPDHVSARSLFNAFESCRRFHKERGEVHG